MGKYKDALRDAEAAIKLDPSWVKAHYRKGQVLDKLGRHSESMARRCGRLCLSVILSVFPIFKLVRS